MLLLDVNKSACGPGLAEIKVLVDPLPDAGVEGAGGEWVEGRAFRYCDIGDDKAGMMLWHVAMDDIRENSVISVEESDDEECEDGYGEELDARANDASSHDDVWRSQNTNAQDAGTESAALLRAIRTDRAEPQGGELVGALAVRGWNGSERVAWR